MSVRSAGLSALHENQVEACSTVSRLRSSIFGIFTIKGMLVY
jgi:hypothetical protein